MVLLCLLWLRLSLIVSGGLDEKVIIWSESGAGGEFTRLQVLEDHTSAILAVCFSPDGKQLATEPTPTK